MKRIFITATIAALALAVTAEAKPNKAQKSSRQVVATQRVNNAVRTTTVVPRARAVTRNYYTTRGYSRGYYGGGYYGGGYPYYSSGPSFSIGIGAGYPYYGYGYGYPYSSGYGYPYGYSNYPSGYSSYQYARSGNVVAEVQDRLARRGYYQGSVDGVAGARTRSAIARYESTHGLIADGRIDARLLRSLGLS
jgi:hypothetical protein